MAWYRTNNVSNEFLDPQNPHFEVLHMFLWLVVTMLEITTVIGGHIGFLLLIKKIDKLGYLQSFICISWPLKHQKWGIIQECGTSGKKVIIIQIIGGGHFEFYHNRRSVGNFFWFRDFYELWGSDLSPCQISHLFPAERVHYDFLPRYNYFQTFTVNSNDKNGN